MDGWIKLHRKLLNWEWYQDSHTLHLFLHLLLQANHQPTRWRGQIIEQGQVLTGRHLLSKQTGLSEQSIRTSLDRLKSTSEITSQPTNRFSIITLVKYKEYQIGDKKSTNTPTNPLTNNQPAINQQVTTSKNDKNVKKLKKEDKDIYGEFQNVLLSVTELQKLKDTFKDRTDELIENISQYIASKGDKYKSHYATILSWERKNSKQGGQQGKTGTPLPDRTRHNLAVMDALAREREEKTAEQKRR